jgi:trimeric autotransporter adhesin
MTYSPKCTTPWLACAALLILSFTGCVNPTLSSISVTPETPSVQTGKTQQMTATGTYSDGSTKTITSTVDWTSSDTSEATVSSTGLVTGVAPGTVTVTAALNDISGTTSVTITIANLASIAITPNNASILSDGSQQFTAIGTLDDGTTVNITDEVTWNSSDTGVATINSSGLATAVATGTTNITASSGSITSNTAVLNVD